MPRTHLALLACSLLGPIAAVPAQGAIPSAHWGALVIPEERDTFRLSLTADRFSEFDEFGRVGFGLNQPGRFPSANQKSFGIQRLIGDYTFGVIDPEHLALTTSVGLGLSSNQPTRFIVNDVAHRIRGAEAVTERSSRETFEATGGLELTAWTERPDGDDETPDETSWVGHAGVGSMVGTLYFENYVQAGGFVETPELDLGLGRARLRFGGLARGSLFATSDAFDDLADGGVLSQAYVSILPHREPEESGIWTWPDFTLGVTHDTGLFRRYDTGDPLDKVFVTFRGEWPCGLRFETWNDLIGLEDFGPTFGLSFSYSFDG